MSTLGFLAISIESEENSTKLDHLEDFPIRIVVTCRNPWCEETDLLRPHQVIMGRSELTVYDIRSELTCRVCGENFPHIDYFLEKNQESAFRKPGDKGVSYQLMNILMESGLPKKRRGFFLSAVLAREKFDSVGDIENRDGNFDYDADILEFPRGHEFPEDLDEWGAEDWEEMFDPNLD